MCELTIKAVRYNISLRHLFMNAFISLRCYSRYLCLEARIWIFWSDPGILIGSGYWIWVLWSDPGILIRSGFFWSDLGIFIESGYFDRIRAVDRTRAFWWDPGILIGCGLLTKVGSGSNLNTKIQHTSILVFLFLFYNC